MNEKPTRAPLFRRRLLTTLLKLAFSAAILALLLIFKTPVRDIIKVLGTVRIPGLALAFSLHAVGYFASAYRWQILARALGDDIPLGFLIRSYLVGTFFNNFLPTSFGGDIVRIWDGSRYSQSLVKSSAIVVVERVTGIVVLFLFALFGSFFRLDMAHNIPVIWVSLVLGLVGLVLVILFLLPVTENLILSLPERKLLNPLKKTALSFRETVLLYRDKKGPFLKAFLWAVILQANVVFYFFLIGRAFGLKIGFLDYFVFVPILLLVQTIPVTINGLGLREGSAIEIFRHYAIPSATAFSFSLVDVGFRLILGVVGGAIYVSRK